MPKLLFFYTVSAFRVLSVRTASGTSHIRLKPGRTPASDAVHHSKGRFMEESKKGSAGLTAEK
ncbi:hypothetical protein, partial [Paraburkholderia sp.]|uniref:hypothetical protein n=1 Tax=Paraburkholderia sp. TaxID=1926495 RepID=UPI002F40E5DA